MGLSAVLLHSSAAAPSARLPAALVTHLRKAWRKVRVWCLSSYRTSFILASLFSVFASMPPSFAAARRPSLSGTQNPGRGELQADRATKEPPSRTSAETLVTAEQGHVDVREAEDEFEVRRFEKRFAWGSREAADPTLLHRRSVAISLDTLLLVLVKIWRSRSPPRSTRTNSTFLPTFAPSLNLPTLLGSSEKL